MASSVSFKGDILTYPWAPVGTYSPPNRWDRNFVPLVAKGRLSAYLPPDWCNGEVSEIPLLVPSPPTSPDEEVRDLFAMIPLRPYHRQAMIAEASYGASDVVQIFKEMLEGAGADLDQLIGGITARQHVENLASIAFNDASVVVMNQKARFNRLRPYQLAPGLMPVIDPLPLHASYPSGHSTQFHTVAFVLLHALSGTRFTNCGYQLLDIVGAIARRREVAGLHYASDTVAGMCLAQLIVEAYLKKDEFIEKYVGPVNNIAIVPAKG